MDKRVFHLIRHREMTDKYKTLLWGFCEKKNPLKFRLKMEFVNLM